jgi:hypothetical protein
MKNLKRIKKIKKKIENLRLEMISITIDLNEKEKNHDDIFEFISTEAENAFNMLLNEFDEFINELE